MRRLTLVLPPIVAAVALVGLGAACQQEQITEEKREVWVDGKKIADVSEIVRKARAGGELVQRRHILVADPREGVLTNVSLDEEGFAEGASYRREGEKGKRYVELAVKDGKKVVFSRGDDETMRLPDLPVVVLETLHRLHAKPNQDVVLLDLENAVALPAKVGTNGELLWADGKPMGAVVGGRVDIAAGTKPPAPGPSPEVVKLLSPTDPVLLMHSSREPFLEAGTKVVTTWCRAQGLGAGPVEAAKALALATKPKLDPTRAGGPPSALMAVQIGGYDESGAALVVACLRALDHNARVVTGTVGDARETRTWAQVHDGTRWVDVDPLDIDLNGASALAHTPRVEGFRGPLTTGLATGLVAP